MCQRRHNLKLPFSYVVDNNQQISKVLELYQKRSFWIFKKKSIHIYAILVVDKENLIKKVTWTTLLCHIQSNISKREFAAWVYIISEKKLKKKKIIIRA